MLEFVNSVFGRSKAVAQPRRRGLIDWLGIARQGEALATSPRTNSGAPRNPGTAHHPAEKRGTGGRCDTGLALSMDLAPLAKLGNFQRGRLTAPLGRLLMVLAFRRSDLQRSPPDHED